MEEQKLLHSKVSLVFALAIIILIFNLFMLIGTSNFNHKTNDLRFEIKSLTKDIQKLNNDTKKIDEKVDSINSLISNANKNIQINNLKIDNLKKYEKGKIDSFDNYTPSMWEKYFTDRYKGKSNNQ